MDLEELFRSRLENAELIPDITVKHSLMRKLGVKEFLHFNPARLNIYYLAGIGVAGITAAIMLFSGSDDPGTVNDITPGVMNEIKSDAFEADSVAVFSKSVQADKHESEASSGVSHKVAENSTLRSDRGKSRSVTLSPDTIRKMVIDNNIPGNETPVVLHKNPSASFIASATEGCMPFKVRFVNNSISYDSCIWSFGDGGYASSVNAEWIYDKPGTYRVTLSVYTDQGASSSSSSLITVFSKPSARFEIKPVNPSSNDDALQFYNYSGDAVRCWWDFGDGTGSSAFEPVHRYEKPGKYAIKLMVWSENGCTDSAVVINTPGTSGYFIRFPNAFIPNRYGPTGGYYSTSTDASAHIFHPEAEGVAEYQLRIFTRTGLLLFESNDINVGWDGYNKGNICQPGVYIWKVRGTYRNGESFLKMGDVTLLRANQ